MGETVDQIKQKLDIVEVLGEYIRLAKAGRNWKARCPFHAEKTPSFMVSQERQIWHCFGCGAGGDIFKFVMQIEGVEFADALRILARRAGVMLQRQDPQVQSQKKRLFEICELAARFFEAQLEKSAPGQAAKKYLLERGMKPETIKTWRLGWAPDDWQALYNFLKNKGYSENEILRTGMITVSESAANKPGARYYDRFRSRIIFPIFDLTGQVIAFGGRIFGAKAGEEAAKYLNSPQTELYDKSRVLYGLDKNRGEIRTLDLCIIVEGYMDLLMSWQAGVANAVASSGTALTEEHLKIIGRYTKNLAMSFDTDLAGDNATRRSIDLALQQNFFIKVILMKDKDPADVVKKDPEDWKKITAAAQSVKDFYFSSTFAKFNSSQSEGRREIIKAILPIVKSLPSQTEQSEWLQEMAYRLRVSEKDLLADLQRIKREPAEKQPSVIVETKALPVQTRQESLEERFLGLCLNNPGHLKNISGIWENDFQNQNLAQIYSELKILANKQDSDPIKRLQKSLPPELKMKIEYLSLKIEQQPVDDLETIAEIETCLKELKVVKIRQQLNNLSFEIKDAQLADAKAKLKELLEKFSQLSTDLINLTKSN